MFKLSRLLGLVLALLVITVVTTPVIAILNAQQDLPLALAAGSLSFLVDENLSSHTSDLRAAISPPAAKIALFDNPAYVDTANNGVLSESDNVQATLTISLGHTVTPFTGITAVDFTAALAGKDILLIPELENGNLGADLTVAARGVISNFVANGGGLIIHGSHDSSISYPPNFLNQVFGFSIVSVGTSSDFDSHLSKNKEILKTAFFDDFNDISNQDATQFLQASSLPAGSKNIYITPFADATSVALMPYGTGQIVFIGWDWAKALPIGTNDGGWLNVLDSAVHQLMPPNLAVSKAVTPRLVLPGQPMTYTIAFSNAGGMAGGLIPGNIVLTDVLPISITNVISKRSGVVITPTGSLNYVWNVPALTPSAGGVITITGLAKASLPEGTIFVNTARIAGTNDTDTTNNQSQATITVTTQITMTPKPPPIIYLPFIAKN